MVVSSAASLRGLASSSAPVTEADWKTFYEEHFDLVWRLLVRFGIPQSDREDLAQDVFAIVHRKLPSFRGQSAIRTWLYTITRRVAARARRRARFREAAVALFGLAAPAAPQEAGAWADVARMLARLSEVQRMTLLLHDVDGMTAPEIGVLMGCPEATVWSRLRLARELLEQQRRTGT